MIDQTARDMIESDEAFRKQFDRESDTFHQGNTTAVAVGGNRIPDGMKLDIADWRSLPVQEQAPEDVGPEAEKLMGIRTQIGYLKKAIESMCKPMDGLLRLIEAEKVEKTDQWIEEEKNNIEINIKAVEEFLPKFDSDSSHAALIKELVSKAKESYSSREVYGNFMLEIKRHQSKLFNEQKSLLQEVKKAKQRYQASIVPSN